MLVFKAVRENTKAKQFIFFSLKTWHPQDLLGTPIKMLHAKKLT